MTAPNPNLIDAECKKDGGGLSPGKPSKEAAQEVLSGRMTSQSEVEAHHRTNYLQTLMHLLNGFVGSGILSMPMTFRNGGLVLSVVCNPLVGLLSCYCIHMLIRVNRLAMQVNHSPPFDYHEIAEFAFSVGPSWAKRRTKLARYVVLTFLVATQLGGCCVYFLFIATNLEQFLRNILGDRAPSKETCLALVLPVIIGINWIRNIRKLSPFSTISNILQLVGLGIIFYNLLSGPLENVSELPSVGDKIPQFLVSTLFIFEGICVSTSLFKAIERAREFYKPLGVLNVGLFVITLVYFSLGLLGYIRYGVKVHETITIDLPSTPMYDSVQLMYVFAVLFTYPIMMYVPIEVSWPVIKRKAVKWFDSGSNANELDQNSNSKKVWIAKSKILIVELAFRALMVLFTYILASVIPKLELIISLVGSVTSSSIAVIIPSTLYLVTFWPRTSGPIARTFLLIKNLSIIGIGVFGFFFGAYFSLQDIIKAYQEDNIENL